MKKSNSNRKHQKKAKPQARTNIAAMALAARDTAKITCKILEYQEMQAIEAEQAGELTNKFAYEYLDKDGNTVRGVRAVGAREAIRFCKVKPYCFIPKFDYEKEELGIDKDGHKWFREVVFCTNPLTKETTRATCQWMMGSRFGDRIASTNAERNALLKHLPAEMKLQFINYCVKKGFLFKAKVNPELPEAKEALAALPDIPETPAPESEKQQAAQQDAKQDTAQLARIYAISYSMGIDSKKMRLWLHKRYKTDSLKALTPETVNKIIKGLQEIQNNVPGKTAKPKANVLTPDLLKEQVEKETADEK